MKELIQSINPTYDQDPDGNVPTVLEFAMLSRLVYFETKEIIDQLKASDWDLVLEKKSSRAHYSLLEIGVESSGEASMLTSLFGSGQKLRVATFFHPKRKIAVFAFKGTELTNVADLTSDADIFLGKKPRLLAEVRPFVEKQADMLSEAGFSIYYTGHSLGGALAEHLSVMLGVSCVTFESPGVHFEVVDPSKTKHIKSYLTKPNFINCAGIHPGEVRRLDLVPPPMSAVEVMGPLAMGELKKIAWEKRDIIVEVLSNIAIMVLGAKGKLPGSVTAKLLAYGKKASDMVANAASSSATERVVNELLETKRGHGLDGIIYTLILTTGNDRVDPECLPKQSSWWTMEEYLFEHGLMLHDPKSLGGLRLGKRYYLAYLQGAFSPEIYNDSRITLENYLFNSRNKTPNELLRAFSQHQIACISGFVNARKEHRIDAGLVAAGEMLCAEYQWLAAQHKGHEELTRVKIYHQVLGTYLKLQKQADAWFYGEDADSLPKHELDQPISPELQNWPAALQYKAMPADGHCLYHAVAHHLDKTHVELREAVVDYLERHKDEYREAVEVEREQSIEACIRDIKNGAWAGDLEISVLMQILHRPIIVVRRDFGVTNPNVLDDYEGDAIFVCYNLGRDNPGDHYDAFEKTEYLADAEIIAQLRQRKEKKDREKEQKAAETKKADAAYKEKGQQGHSGDRKQADNFAKQVSSDMASVPKAEGGEKAVSGMAAVQGLKRSSEKSERVFAAVVGGVVGATVAVAITAASFGEATPAGVVAGKLSAAAASGFLTGMSIGASIDLAIEFDESMTAGIEAGRAAKEVAQEFYDRKGYTSTAKMASNSGLVGAHIAVGMNSGRASKEELLQEVGVAAGYEPQSLAKGKAETAKIEKFIRATMNQTQSGALSELVGILKNSDKAKDNEADQAAFSAIKEVIELSEDSQTNAEAFDEVAEKLRQDFAEMSAKQWESPESSVVIPAALFCTVGKLLAGGMFGEVYKGKLRYKTKRADFEPYQELAIKYFIGEVTRETLLKRCQEIRSLSLRSDYSSFLIRVMGVTEPDQKPAIYMEYLSGGTLHKRLYHNAATLLLHTKLRWGVEVGLGLSYLHENGLLHEDLRSANVGLTSEEDTATAKLIDFGFSDLSQSCQSTQTQRKTGKPSDVLTPPQWRAPELAPKGRSRKMPPATKASDVYSYAMLLYELFSRNMPFWASEDFNVFNEVREGARPPVVEAEFSAVETFLAHELEKEEDPDEKIALDKAIEQCHSGQQEIQACPPDAVEVMKRAWSAEPKERPPAEELVGVLSACHESQFYSLEKVRITPEVPLQEAQIHELENAPERIYQLLHSFFILQNAVSRLGEERPQLGVAEDDVELAGIRLSYHQQRLASVGVMILASLESVIPMPDESKDYSFGAPAP